MSNEHLFLNPKIGSDYWNFTVHELALYDVPAHVDYILEETNATQVIYVGHSQGTTQWFLANSLHTDLHLKFKAFVGIAPVVHAGHIHTPVLDTLLGLRVPDILN